MSIYIGTKITKKLLFYQQLMLFVIGMSINKSIVINCFKIKLMNGKPSFNRNVIKTLLTSNMLYLLFTYNGTNDLMCIHLHCKTTRERECKCTCVGVFGFFLIRNYDKREHVFSGRGSLLNHLRIDNSALSIT